MEILDVSLDFGKCFFFEILVDMEKILQDDLFKIDFVIVFK